MTLDERLSNMTLDGLSVQIGCGTDFIPTELLKDLGKIPHNTPPGNHDDPEYLHWGFPIYRTAYGGSTDQQWEMLIARIQSEVASELAPFQTGDASFDRVRQIYNDGIGGMAAKHHYERYQLFLIADAEVMAAVARGDFWMKCVDPRYKPEDYISTNRRVGLGLKFLGYMWMTTESLTALWVWLYIRELNLIAPPLINERLTEVWNGD
ncbi:uncharacterized protein DNG_02387 [Cephalotrichum gorgonifer]|uniref:Uncharacterized protein n=1 Tax=Cephalotrichum gorgonifer TaxID=2041049 RepID=A0AAE8MUD0_9PEZI|nr:uncharacterized protein DNG_02387 [Cephalotrichum gorgonifer]